MAGNIKRYFDGISPSLAAEIIFPEAPKKQKK